MEEKKLWAEIKCFSSWLLNYSSSSSKLTSVGTLELVNAALISPPTITTAFNLRHPLSSPLSPSSPPFHIAASVSHCINPRLGRLGVIRHAGHQLAKRQRAFCATAHLFSALGRSWSQRAAPGNWKRAMMRRPSWRDAGGRRPTCLPHSCTLATHSECGTYG